MGGWQYADWGWRGWVVVFGAAVRYGTVAYLIESGWDSFLWLAKSCKLVDIADRLAFILGQMYKFH